jgi:hypothetical protein
MIFIFGGFYFLGVAICIPLFFDRDDPWGIVWAVLWPVLVLAAIAGLFLGACANFYAFIFHDTAFFSDDEDPHG